MGGCDVFIDTDLYALVVVNNDVPLWHHLMNECIKLSGDNKCSMHSVCCLRIKGLIMDRCVLLTSTPECVVAPRWAITRAQPE